MSRTKKRRMYPDLNFDMRPHKPKRAKGFLYTQKYIPDDRADPPDEPLIKVIPREEWGAMPPKATAPMTIPATHVRYNQTRTDACMFKEECIGILQKIQKEHMEVKGLNDIQYHFMIGGDGTVYEGRGWKNKGEKHPGIKEKEYFDVAYIGNYDKYQVPESLIFALYKFLDQIENASLVTMPYVFFNDLKELEKTPEDLLTHEVFGHVSNWDVTQPEGFEYNSTPKANKDIEWTEEEKALGHERGELKLTPEEIEYLFANKNFTTDEDDAKRIDEWAEENRSYYEPHYADVILQESKDEYEKIHGVKYDEDFSEWAMTMNKPPPPPSVYRDPKSVHGEESIITQMENLMRPGAHRFDKYGKEIPLKNERTNVGKEQDDRRDDEDSLNEGNIKRRGGKKSSYSREKGQELEMDEMPSCFNEEYIDEEEYLSSYTLDGEAEKPKPSRTKRRNLKDKAVEHSNYEQSMYRKKIPVKQKKNVSKKTVVKTGDNNTIISGKGNLKKRRGRKPRVLQEENKETFTNPSSKRPLHTNKNKELEPVIDKTTSGFDEKYIHENGYLKVKPSTINRIRPNNNTSFLPNHEIDTNETDILIENKKKNASKGKVGIHKNYSDVLGLTKLRGRKPRVSGLTESSTLDRQECTDLYDKEYRNITKGGSRDGIIPVSFQDDMDNSRSRQTVKKHFRLEDSNKKEESDKPLRFQINKDHNDNKEKDIKSKGLYKFVRSSRYVPSDSAKRRIQLMKERSKEKCKKTQSEQP